MLPSEFFFPHKAVTSFPCNLLLDIHSSATCLGLHRSLVFYTTIHSLSSSTISWVLDQDSELSTSLASAQHSHQSPLEVPRGHHALISCAGISHLSRSCKTNLHVPWRFLIPCPVQALLPGKSQPGIRESSFLAFQVLAEGKIDAAG